ncbi:uncharacterized protein PHACADRAFT_265727 [Phanerochaete carnosa HHB-10118-sp]|uniref:Uncharacterized protein n=1 Tax=Phanerochaete carnosa (strain HHB-10118-sp) TaxID=650164 RepID=K5VRN1_PHACS|nr:uncharacterized protein PHACADRAFT_265727 [Phanerochaete carnosa HHB-10118-sp]EKM49239.1 hypothetical protein PHACADRAFT_265727 [Phanerochaete carnosa HHB-10118-sp]
MGIAACRIIQSYNTQFPILRTLAVRDAADMSKLECFLATLLEVPTKSPFVSVPSIVR